jgi:hypothetical protein
MCLIPGTLSHEVSRPNSTAKIRAQWLLNLSYSLLLLACLRVLSFSIWSALSDLFAGLYGIAMIKANFGIPGEERLVMIENILCYGLLLAFLTSVDVMTIITIVLRTQMFQQELQEWQVITGIIVSGVALAIYLAVGITIYLLYRSLKETVLVSHDEASSFLGGGGGGGSNNNNTGRVSTSASSSFRQQQQQSSIFGSLVSGVGKASTPQDTKSDNEKFPGKPYKLQGDV